ncbi:MULTISPECIES: UbiA family prenyltransferase [unclassified Cupriavidus]|uniref:UbiA family prenyltransferase n=1 Tax=unclassified Cupriavidus TaxID=2640874 RepID=UPI00136574D5|nr:UbiA family prenyltransferase [Cupriavidus sp. SW-Y-13]MWL87327.1 UbiA family prenyltransferase [Cupriavidus sp. SW-Y-13]
MSHAAVPLCVDLDGTLIHGDLLMETCVALLRKNPLYLFLLPWWLFRGGKAHLKAQIASRVLLNHAVLPFHREFVQWLTDEKRDGRQIWLCTASNQRLAEAVATHLQLFDGVLASTDTLNLSGKQKADMLVAKFGSRAFDYCGNDRVDLHVWSVSRGGVVVNGHGNLEARARKVTEVYRTFGSPGHHARAVWKLLRPHQWAKNVLLLVPLLAAHRGLDPTALGHAALGLLAFCLCASSVYVLNDMLDVEADRQHPRKALRPFASGALPLKAGFVLIPLLLFATAGIAMLLPLKFGLVLAAYYLLTLGYTLGIKQLVIVDVLCLAGLYTIRIVAGAAAVDVPLSLWLLLFSLFLFLSLALVKRFAELQVMKGEGKLEAAGRGYRLDDLALLESLGTGAGYMCVLVLALYINNPVVEVLYRQPQVLWALCPLMLYWITRVWVVSHRGQMHDDPVMFALRDRASVVIGVLAAVVVWAAT